MPNDPDDDPELPIFRRFGRGNEYILDQIARGLVERAEVIRWYQEVLDFDNELPPLEYDIGEEEVPDLIEAEPAQQNDKVERNEDVLKLVQFHDNLGDDEDRCWFVQTITTAGARQRPESAKKE